MDIAPIMPSEKFQFESDNSETLYFNNIEENRTLESDQSAGFSPVMQKETFDKLTSKVESILGDEKLPEGQLTFLFSEPDDLALKNPPVLQFSFVAPESSIFRDDIQASLDNQDFSNLLTISKVNISWRKADIFHAVLKPDFILDPRIEHELNIRITPEGNNSLVHTDRFNVPVPPLPHIVSAGFRWDKTMTEPSMNELQVFMDIPEGIDLENRIMNPLAWNLTYENETELPPLTSIQKHPSGIKNLFIIELNSEAIQNQKVRMIFSPFSGMNTRQFEFSSPTKPPERDGEFAERHVSETTCNDCTGSYSSTPPDGDVHSAVNCDENHTFHIKAFCPTYPGCIGKNVHIFDQFNSYIFDPLKYYQIGELEDTGTITPDVPIYIYGESACADIIRSIPHYYNFRAMYRMRAWIGYRVCDYFATIEEAVFSDTVAPSISSVEFPEIDISAPSCTETCCKQSKYHLIVDASDNNCMNPARTMLIIFYGDGSYRDLPLQFVGGQTLEGGKRIIQEFVIDTANIFACAVGLKVIVHDKKGNWKAVMVQPQEGAATERDEGRLPYPSRLVLNLGDRNFYHGDRQYVNLNRQYQKDYEYCVYRPDNINHGAYVLLEVEVLPPIYGVIVQVEWLDPPSYALCDNIPPTNLKGTAHGSSACNPTLSAEDNELLWSIHEAWGIDGRSLGDNYNYFGDPDDCGTPFAPDCDPNDISSWPIRSHSPNAIPCFLYPPCNPGIIDPNDPEYCVDLWCAGQDDGTAAFPTNILGKMGVLFDTQGFGGDNFVFKATTRYSHYGLDNCLECYSLEVITNWRKIYACYAWMAPRNISKECSQKKEYKGNCENQGDFKNITTGVFDDCYIELDWTLDYPNTTYKKHIQNRSGGQNFPGKEDYPVYYVPYFNREINDRLLHLDVDHVWDPCVSTHLGFTNQTDPIDLDPMDQRFFSYTALGNIYDRVVNKKWRYIIDNVKYKSIYEIGKHNTSHELTHNIYNYPEPDLDNRCPYGIMSYYDRRWYHHKDDILLLRTGLPVYDQNQF